ncbi:hypothetical protein C8R45DRAFT_500827 [Mycena sanguinolenta]|nr:hypothetical protein C8R45DRAFT_500827 [Mycena sanguinolenta]
MYHAKICCDPGTVTVVMYQGNGAEEEWRQHVAKYESIRHPHIMQLYALVSTKGLYAMVFYDELIPYAQFLRRFEHSPFLSAYIVTYCTAEFKDATNYISDVFFSSVLGLFNPLDCSAWIRPLTGELCLELAPASSSGPWGPSHMPRVENVSLDAPDSEDAIISSLSEDQYHKLCSGLPIAQFQCVQASTQHFIGPGIFRDSQRGTCVRITKPLVIPEEELYWNHDEEASGEVLPNSWVQYDSHQTPKLDLGLSFSSYELLKAWLAQANRIFAELEDVANVESYVCIHHVQFSLQIAGKCHIPEGYLFICSSRDFRNGTENVNLYQWPACPAYWSLNPSGADRLSTEDARIIGFPAIHIETRISGYSWDHSIYKGLRRFHEGKGLDPESREIARQLGYPLYEVLSDLGSEMPFPTPEVSDGSWPWKCEQDDPALCPLLGHYL